MSLPSLRGKKLGVLVSSSPNKPHFLRMVALLQAAVESGVAVYLYCIDDGVQCINTEEIQKLKSQGINLFGCAYGAQRREIELNEAAVYSGLTIVADLIAGTDRFLSFN